MQKKVINLTPLLKNLKSMEQNMLQLKNRSASIDDIVALSGTQGRNAKLLKQLLTSASLLSQVIQGSGKSLSFNKENLVTEPRVSNNGKKAKSF